MVAMHLSSRRIPALAESDSDLKQKETDIAATIVSWLEAQEWETYKEVQVFRYGTVADIVAVKGRLIWVIETKLTLTFEVIAQAIGWRGYAHFVSIGIPVTKRYHNKGRHLAEQVCEDYGLGIISVDGQYISSDESPRLDRKTFMIQYIRDSLTPEQKASVAGSAGSNHWTPWKTTCRDLLKVVTKTPGITMKDAVSELKQHHYASDATAIGSLRQWINLNKIKGIEGRVEKGKLRLYPNETNGDMV